MLTIFRGDDTSFGDFERKVCIYLKTTQDLTGWSASFQLIDNIKTFSDLTNGYVAFSYSAAETNEFPLGQTQATLKIYDSNGRVRSLKKVDVEVQNQTPIQDAGVIAVSADCVITDFKSIGNKPSINGKVIDGAHDGAYYGLASQDNMEICAACNASQQVEIEALKVTTQQNATNISDQGVAIARNTQDIIGLKASVAQDVKDVAKMKARVDAIGTDIDSNVEAEEVARKADTAAIRTSLDTEQSNRETADRALRSDLEAEKTARADAVSALTTMVNTEKGNRETDVARLEDEISSEKAVRASADTALDNKLDTTKTELNSKITTVSGNVTELKEGFKADLVYLKGKVDDADARLEQKIEDEATARANAVTAEATTRKSEDERIETKTNQTFVEVKASIASEIQQRQLLNNALASEIIRRESGDATNATAIANETTARTNGDTATLASAKEYTDAKCGGVLRYAGQKQTYNDLISDESARVVGNVYNVVETGANYAWNGSSWDKLSEDIDLTPYAKKTEVQEAVNTLTAKDTELANSIATEKLNRETAVSAEATTRASADEVLTDAVAAEAATARDKESKLGLRIDGVTTDYKAADTDILATVNTKEAALKAKDTELEARINNITKDTDGLIATEKAAREAADAAEKSAREAAVTAEENTRIAADATEKAAREAADGTLDSKIDGEIENRQTADTTLRTDMTALINAEKSRAEDAEEALGVRIDTEIADRTAAVTAAKDALTTSINNEKDLRKGGDTALGGRIDTEITDRQGEITRVETAYKAADTAINATITQKETESKARDTELTTNLGTETEERKAADTAIRNNFTEADAQIRVDFAEADATNLQAAKDYADTVGAKAMHFKGYVENRSALEAKSATAVQGDMYNVGSYEFDDGKVVQGANFAWTGSAWDKLSETIDLSPYAKTTDVTTAIASAEARVEAKVTAEKTRAEGIEGGHETRITALEGTVSTNTADITTAKTDIANLKTKTDTTNTNLAQEVQDRKDADNLIKASVTQEEQDRIAAINTVNGTITSTKTNLESMVSHITSALEAKDSALVGKIATETKNRGTEITRVEGLITAERGTRATAVTTLTTAIETEVTRAGNAETALQTAVSNEASARIAADTKLNDAITAEQTARSTRDGELTTLINNMDAAYKAADTTLDGKITAGIAECKTYTDNKYKSVDESIASLQTSIDACNRAVNTWQAQITTNKTNIENEILRAKAREDGLDERLDATVLSTNKAMPKSYIDDAIKHISDGTTPMKQLAFTSTSAGAEGTQYTLTVVIEDGEPSLQLVETPAS